MATEVLQFRDDDGFYKRLRAELSLGNEVSIATDFIRYEEVPQKLRDIFELDRARSPAWVGASGVFLVGASAAGGFNSKPLIVLGAAATGAAVGWLFGPVGIAIGAGVGLATGTVAAAFVDRKHEVEIEIDAKGKLTLRIRPRKR